jgi:pimeloyl-ACP methyl ester carboxylesterase
MRARYPDSEGYVERDGVRTFYEVYGEGDPTILMVPTWSIVHSRAWKGQIPYLARHFRVVSSDGRGNGRSDRPPNPSDYVEEEFAADLLAVMDATDTERAILVSVSRGIERSLHLAANHPGRVAGIITIGPALPMGPVASREDAEAAFTVPRDSYEGWDKWNANYWHDDYEGFLEFFASQVFTEPHSTKQIEDFVGWGLETDAATLVATQLARRFPDEDAVRELAARVRCPVLVIHGTGDAVRPHASGAAFADLIGGEFVSLEGSGHSPQARVPVKTNLLIREFAESVRAAPATRSRAAA